MPATAFDTLSWAKQLEKAGASKELAEAQVIIFADIAGKSLAFPADLVTLENNLTHKMALVEARIDKVETELINKIEKIETKLTAHIDHVEAKLTAQIAEAIDKMTWRLFAALAPLYLFGLTALAKALHWF